MAINQLAMPLSELAAAFGLPDGLEVVSVREADGGRAVFKVSDPGGAIPSSGVEFHGIGDRPKCRMVAAGQKSCAGQAEPTDAESASPSRPGPPSGVDGRVDIEPRSLPGCAGLRYSAAAAPAFIDKAGDARVVSTLEFDTAEAMAEHLRANDGKLYVFACYSMVRRTADVPMFDDFSREVVVIERTVYVLRCVEGGGAGTAFVAGPCSPTVLDHGTFEPWVEVKVRIRLNAAQDVAAMWGADEVALQAGWAVMASLGDRLPARRSRAPENGVA